MASIISLVTKKEDFNTMEQFFLKDNSKTTTTMNPGNATINPNNTTLSRNNRLTNSPINDNKVPSKCGDIGDAFYSFKDYDTEYKNPETDFTIHMNDKGKISYRYSEGCTSFNSDYQCSNNNKEEDNDNKEEDNDNNEDNNEDNNDNNEDNNEDNNDNNDNNESMNGDIYINENKILTDEQINRVSKQILINNDNNDIIDKAIPFIKNVGLILLVLFVCLGLYLFLN